jgi:hypothetical protein
MKGGEMGGVCSMHGEGEKFIQNFIGEPEGKRPLGRPGHWWQDTIKIDLREIGFGVVDWVHLAQNRDQWWALANMVMNLCVL